MLEHITDYANQIWHSTLVNRIEWAIAIGVVTELLVWLLSRRLRRAFAPVLQRDLVLDATERVRRRRIILGLPLLLLRVVLYGLALALVLRYLGLNPAAELVPLTIGVLAVGAIAGWRTLQDAVAGYFIAYDNLFAVGDRVTIGDLTGTVMEAGLRFTRLRAADSRELVIANHTITQVVNHTRVGEGERRPGR
ncbi:MAG: mechanosensitive ion channel family protein [Armatimonadetes bacterium]|nr:mechanosensitive ion channel family protein [Armatimonadota bacterium]